MPNARDLPLIAADEIDDQTSFLVIDGNNGENADAQRVNFNSVLPSIRGIVDSAQQYVDNANSALSENRQTVNNYVNNGRAQTPIVNLLTNSRGVPGNEQLIGEFESFCPFLTQFNGASEFTNVGKFIHENTTEGGFRGEINDNVRGLLFATNRTGADRRIGIEFFIGRVIAGNGTVREHPDYQNHNLLFASSDGFVGVRATLGMWLRIVSGSCVIGAEKFLVNGILADRVLPTGQWIYVAIQTNRESTAGGLASLFPYIYATAGAEVDVALPTLSPRSITSDVTRVPVPELGVV